MLCGSTVTIRLLPGECISVYSFDYSATNASIRQCVPPFNCLYVSARCWHALQLGQVLSNVCP
jgi:hypothetical protein